MTVLMVLLSGVPGNRTGHAVASAASAAELLACDRVHLDTGARELGVGRLVPLVGDDRPGGKGDDVVAVVPLVPLCLELVAARGDDVELLEPELLLHHVDERPL